MATDKSKPALAAGMPRRSDLDVLPERGVVEIWPISEYKYRYTTGPFLLPENSGSLDWGLLNNTTTQQRARVTVFQCGIGTVKSPVPPGPLAVTVEPGELTHNANEYAEGYYYEVVVECNSRYLFPYVSVWPGHWGVVIPGTGITAGDFVRLMP